VRPVSIRPNECSFYNLRCITCQYKLEFGMNGPGFYMDVLNHRLGRFMEVRTKDNGGGVDNLTQLVQGIPLVMEERRWTRCDNNTIRLLLVPTIVDQYVKFFSTIDHTVENEMLFEQQMNNQFRNLGVSELVKASTKTYGVTIARYIDECTKQREYKVPPLVRAHLLTYLIFFVFLIMITRPYDTTWYPCDDMYRMRGCWISRRGLTISHNGKPPRSFVWEDSVEASSFRKLGARFWYLTDFLSDQNVKETVSEAILARL